MNTQGTDGRSVTVGLPELERLRTTALATRNNLKPSDRRHGLLSNIGEIAKNLPDYERPAWATHPMQTLPGMLAWQERCLAEGAQ